MTCVLGPILDRSTREAVSLAMHRTNGDVPSLMGAWIKVLPTPTSRAPAPADRDAASPTKFVPLAPTTALRMGEQRLSREK